VKRRMPQTCKSLQPCAHPSEDLQAYRRKCWSGVRTAQLRNQFA
jgi:predicted RNA-binding protein with PUA-like domain